MANLTLELSDDIDNCLSQIAIRNSITKAEAIKRAFALLAIADNQKQRAGCSLGIIRERDDHTLEIIGRVTGL
ncbi:MAG: hypothetical protein PW845_24460 [Pseudomonas sp.]|uniref:hypothetical protein n=1 Tax=Pseudomonas abieticivorans TaxID=2931382 RepID=UPI0020BDEF62|nr:hypothetical protein [Pseudomonas sp. PIA16]MDE1168447.1 hypothetical protein [Pseudomonas sp.]